MVLSFIFVILSAINVMILANLITKQKELKKELKNISLLNSRIESLEKRVKMLRDKGLI